MLGQFVIRGLLGIELLVFFWLLGMLVFFWRLGLAPCLLLFVGLLELQRLLGMLVFFRQLGVQQQFQQFVEQRHRDLR